MSLTKFTGAINTIQSLSDRPNQNEGLTAAQLKIKFDQYAIDNATFVNEVLIPEIDEMGTSKSGALETHKESSDHDERYYTESEIDNKMILTNDNAKDNIKLNNGNTLQYNFDKLATLIASADSMYTTILAMLNNHESIGIIYDGGGFGGSTGGIILDGGVF